MNEQTSFVLNGAKRVNSCVDVYLQVERRKGQMKPKKKGSEVYQKPSPQ